MGSDRPPTTSERLRELYAKQLADFILGPRGPNDLIVPVDDFIDGSTCRDRESRYV